jgi:hypothetical protein
VRAAPLEARTGALGLVAAILFAPITSAPDYSIVANSVGELMGQGMSNA